MAETTSIQWTNATWNPVTGCTKVSPGCLHCYAETLSKRFQQDGPHVPWTVAAQRKAGVSGVFLHHDRLTAPLRWKAPRRIFVNSMSDLFHEAVPDSFIDLVFAVMALAQRHTFQVLTKRPERMLEYLTKPVDELKQDWKPIGVPPASRASVIGWAAQEWADCTGFLLDPKKSWQHQYPLPKHYQDVVGKSFMDNWMTWPLPNVWLGTSVENQRWADERLDALARCPAPVRFVSAEPLLGPVDLRRWLTSQNSSGNFFGHLVKQRPALSWVICGGESGPKARPFDLAWARDVRDQCKEAGVPFFMKQIGAVPFQNEADGLGAFGDRAWNQLPAVRAYLMRDSKGGDPAEWPADLRVREMPEVRS